MLQPLKLFVIDGVKNPFFHTLVASACHEEEKRIRIENDKLRKEINDLKNRLIAAEMRNGGKLDDNLL